VKSEDTRSDLQRRIAAELSAKGKKNMKDVDFEPDEPDGVDDSAYLKDFTNEGKLLKLSGTWWLLIGIFIVAIILIIVLAVVK
jgi:hypothetical protein